jgi:hypothetical protein
MSHGSLLGDLRETFRPCSLTWYSTSNLHANGLMVVITKNLNFKLKIFLQASERKPRPLCKKNGKHYKKRTGVDVKKKTKLNKYISTLIELTLCYKSEVSCRYFIIPPLLHTQSFKVIWSYAVFDSKVLSHTWKINFIEENFEAIWKLTPSVSQNSYYSFMCIFVLYRRKQTSIKLTFMRIQAKNILDEKK